MNKIRIYKSIWKCVVAIFIIILVTTKYFWLSVRDASGKDLRFAIVALSSQGQLNSITELAKIEAWRMIAEAGLRPRWLTPLQY